MRICLTDPISGRDVRNITLAPFVIEGRGDGAIKIYFESERNKAEYQGVELEYDEDL
ncbi:MAG TPA: hypothetical protein VLA41_00315 [Burkholderiales bacterium]|nr:hypothetical protein [Burkholderiales bacterium]